MTMLLLFLCAGALARAAAHRCPRLGRFGTDFVHPRGGAEPARRRHVDVWMRVRVVGPVLVVVAVLAGAMIGQMLEARGHLVRSGDFMRVAPGSLLPGPVIHHQQALAVVAARAEDVEVLLALGRLLLPGHAVPLAVPVPCQPRW